MLTENVQKSQFLSENAWNSVSYGASTPILCRRLTNAPAYHRDQFCLYLLHRVFTVAGFVYENVWLTKVAILAN